VSIALSLRVLALAFGGISASWAQGSPIVPAAEAVAGVSQVDWSVRWWQWAWSFPHEESPVADRTGQACASKQAGEVWFLAGTYGTRRTVRRCTVPFGKYLFFPLINYVVFPSRGAQMTCAAMKADAARLTEGPQALVLEIDDKRIDVSREQRQAPFSCFDLGAKAEPAMRVFPSASDGYYVMLAPLPRGTHVINFGGILPSMSQAVTYTLTVE
jgi:hypothetical protein